MSTALYRRYRPETFADVIGQEHVTEPLRQALRTNRVNHAYLFSGPRGCGKTTSARILARILNCARREPNPQGVWPDAPCGECDSCRQLSREGSGSLDVVEIDAASHGGVDDARELRERATFVPARDRYKVFVIDEAHMVSPQGFNALLKIVEEPPEHVRFIFATTEPGRVLPTIRSRTHHYPFHLVPSARRLAYLKDLCEQEAVPVGKGVLELVVRAGEGSVRDSLSVLDQLIAGADEAGLDYERAVALLGYTHAALLDDVVDALAAGDGASVFRVVDHVIESGHDPRRFVDDLLERLRDLIIIRAVGEAASAVLRGLPEDQMARMAGQAQRFGSAELSRAADVTNAALTEMTGATSPRLHLELLCARLLLPGADASERGLTARLDRLERRVQVPVGLPSNEVPPSGAREPRPHPQPGGTDARGGQAWEVREAATRPEVGEPALPVTAAQPPEAPQPAPSVSTSERSNELDAVRRMWPEVHERLKSLKRNAWSTTTHAHILEVSNGVLLLGFTNAGALSLFRRGSHAEFVRQALIDVLGLDVAVEATQAQDGAADVPRSVDTASAPPQPPRDDAPPAPAQPAPSATTQATAAQSTAAQSAATQPAAAQSTAAQSAAASSAQGTPARGDGPRDRSEAESLGGERPAGSRRGQDVARVSPENDTPELDDPDAEDSGLVGAAVVEQLLGGKVISVED